MNFECPTGLHGSQWCTCRSPYSSREETLKNFAVGERLAEAVFGKKERAMHDVNGKPLAVGDEVVLRAKITAIHAAENFCNVNIEAVHPMPTGEPGGRKETYASVNTKMLEKVE